MASQRDVTAAKDLLSARLLRGHHRGRKAARTVALTLEGARRNAARQVFGVGVARKIVAGRTTNQLCVRLYVAQKLPLSAIPRASRLPSSLDGVPTDVVEALAPHFHVARRAPPQPAPTQCSMDRTKRQRPLVGGISAAHYAVNITTLGCLCRSKRASESGRMYMLSCNHAFANMNTGAPGDRILQPSPGHGGGSSPDGDVAGYLARFVPLQMDGSTPNYMDAAIAEVAPGVAASNDICMIGPLRGARKAMGNMRVRKHGCKSGYSEGIVDSLDFDWTLPYGGSGWVHLTKQLHISPAGYPAFGLPGDSGSVVVAHDSAYAVGLYLAGADDGSYGIASPIDKVCAALQISIP